jgi:hypothetical protein
VTLRETERRRAAASSGATIAAHGLCDGVADALWLARSPVTEITNAIGGAHDRDVVADRRGLQEIQHGAGRADGADGERAVFDDAGDTPATNGKAKISRNPGSTPSATSRTACASLATACSRSIVMARASFSTVCGGLLWRARVPRLGERAVGRRHAHCEQMDPVCVFDQRADLGARPRLSLPFIGASLQAAGEDVDR